MMEAVERWKRKADRLDRLEKQWASCGDCPLSEGRTNVVQWRGNPEARLFIVGEAPGADEDYAGRPFIGASGKLLDELLREVELDEERVFIANIVGCRPPGNRAPFQDERTACSPRLEALLTIVDPACLLLLGREAGKLTGARSVFGHRGAVDEVEKLCWDGKIRRWPAVITFHPAFLLRARSDDMRRTALRDIRLAKRTAGL